MRYTEEILKAGEAAVPRDRAKESIDDLGKSQWFLALVAGTTQAQGRGAMESGYLGLFATTASALQMALEVGYQIGHMAALEELVGKE